ncbi:MAG: HAD family hydrolase, partial [Alistipes sp.]
MIRGVLFDMDGVLVNNTRAHVRAFEIFCKRYGVEEWQRKLQTSFGMGNDDIMRQILPEEIIREKGLKALGEEKEAIYREVYAPEIRPVRGLVDLLEELRRRGIPCAVGSSGCRENVDFVLGNCGIADYFSCIVSGDRVTRCKPDPEIYLLAAEGLHLLPADCLVFEDARAGITAARRAGAGR